MPYGVVLVIEVLGITVATVYGVYGSHYCNYNPFIFAVVVIYDLQFFKNSPCLNVHNYNLGNRDTCSKFVICYKVYG